ncbi:MAG: 50S ribosomal protein L11 methyltransferase [Chloroflexi bacterium]|nr:50S ribosomal protein L11 methyltransferase [Chloroflexota bacterium]
MSRKDEEAVSWLFRLYGHGGVVIEEFPGVEEGDSSFEGRTVVIKTYLSVNGRWIQRLKSLEDGLHRLVIFGPLSPLRTQHIEEEEWAAGWKEYFPLHRVGSHLVVKPSWREYSPLPEDVVIHLDPGMAFGTGLHPTTRMCLEELEIWLRPGDSVLDLGTGSGILAIAAAQLGAAKVLALDIDSLAVRVARENVARNQVESTVSVVRGSLGTSRGRVSRDALKFDLVVANLDSTTISRLLGPITRAADKEGRLILGGISQDGLEAVMAAASSYGIHMLRVVEDGPWRTLVARFGTTTQG